MTTYVLLAGALFLAATTIVSGAVTLLAVRQLVRDNAQAEAAIAALHIEMRGRLNVIENTADEAVGRLRVVTAEYSGGYDSPTFARVSAGGREQLETATAGLEAARWN